MAYYLWQGRLSKDSIEAMVQNPQSRTEAARSIIEAAGGTLHHYFFALGEDDLVLLTEFPDNASGVAVSMAVGATGAVEDVKTTALLTMDEAVEAMRTAQRIGASYRPPQG